MGIPVNDPEPKTLVSVHEYAAIRRLADAALKFFKAHGEGDEPFSGLSYYAEVRSALREVFGWPPPSDAERAYALEKENAELKATIDALNEEIAAAREMPVLTAFVDRADLE